MKMYIIVRGDLLHGPQGVQGIHAMSLFSAEHPEIRQDWYENHKNIALLSVPDETALKHLLSRAEDAGLACSAFREPDYDDSVTAIVIEPAGSKLVSNLPLAMRPPRRTQAAA